MSIRFKRDLFLVFFILTMGALLAAQTLSTPDPPAQSSQIPDKLTLDDAIRIALEQHPMCRRESLLSLVSAIPRDAIFAKCLAASRFSKK